MNDPFTEMQFSRNFSSQINFFNWGYEVRGRSQITSCKKDFFDPPSLVTNFPKKEKFCVRTVTNSSTPPPKRDVICERPLIHISDYFHWFFETATA